MAPEQLPPNKGDRPKRHHTVPRFYLERFAVDGSVELVDRNDYTKWFLRTVDQALFENHFYSIDTDEGRDQVIEKMLADEVDTPGCEAMRRLFDLGRSLAAPGPRRDLSLFLAVQFIRGPSTRHALIENEKAAFQKMALMLTPEMLMRGARERGEEMTEEHAAGLVAFAQSREYTLKIEHEANLHIGTAFPTVLEAVPFFHDRSWRVLEFDQPYLITGDEPVALTGSDPSKPGASVGLANAREILFPVDPRCALVMIRPDIASEQGRFPATPAQAEIINRHVAFHAHRFIVRTPGTNTLAQMEKPPEKAPMVFEIGDMISMSTHASVETRAKVIKQIRKKPLRRVPG